MSGEKRVVADLSWEFTAGLVRGILIGSGIVQDRSCVGGRRAACWEKAGRREEGIGTAWVGTTSPVNHHRTTRLSLLISDLFTQSRNSLTDWFYLKLQV